MKNNIKIAAISLGVCIAYNHFLLLLLAVIAIGLLYIFIGSPDKVKTKLRVILTFLKNKAASLIQRGVVALLNWQNKIR